MSQTLDWNSIQTTLVRLATANIAEFAAEHSGETFYGFAFDCNADYGQATPCLNTVEFHKLAVDGQHLSPEIVDGYEKTGAELGLLPEAEKPREERAESLRWALGDWKYQDFSNEEYEDGWETVEDVLSESLDEDEDEQEIEAVKGAFLRTVCRAALQLENSGAFDCLKKTDDFRILVVDHDEDEVDGWTRLEAVRSKR